MTSVDMPIGRVIDSATKKVTAIILGTVAETYGLPGHLRPGRNGDPLVTHCADCGVNADQVGVDPCTELCDTCAEAS
ncbi:MAG TPA: hypothetical protein VFY10_11540 [Dehalococcoidia bacterium]|nr:hypothetical protein [Dehalococcoidia bacterium]